MTSTVAAHVHTACRQRNIKMPEITSICVQAWPRAQSFYQNVTASLRDFYGTFTTSLPLSVILHSVTVNDL